MMRAKLRGYISAGSYLAAVPALRLEQICRTTRRAMAYFKEPDMKMGARRDRRSVEDEPDNPYFLRNVRPDQCRNGKVNDGLEPYRHAVSDPSRCAVDRIALAAALLGTENPKYTAEAAQELQTALSQDFEDSFAWYELAQAYGRQGQTGKAELATGRTIFCRGCVPTGDAVCRQGTAAAAAGFNGLATEPLIFLRLRRPSEKQ
jgi:predicted Zn-dependent protease